MSNNKNGCWAIGLACGLALSSAAIAGLTDPIFTITATNANGTDTFTAVLADGFFDAQGVGQWNRVTPFSLIDGNGDTIAILEQASLITGAGPRRMSVNFVVRAGELDCDISITSGLYDFPTNPNARGRATTSINLTSNDDNGATMDGTLGGNAMYEAFYNGTLYDGLQDTALTALPRDSNSRSESSPPAGFTNLGVDVNDINVRWGFTLTAVDAAGGTSNFIIVPAPGALALLGIGGLLAARRRR